MTSWLEPLRRVLDASAEEVEIFFRDDDVGWADDRLDPLLDLFAERRLPLDLAVIPTAVDLERAERLVRRGDPLLAVHQHGFAHQNHEPYGRPSEFGPSRPARAQLDDITAGRDRLDELFGDLVAPVFTPPWNRCVTATGQCLVAAGLAVLSCDRTAQPLDIPALAELPVAVDWFAKRKGVPLTRAEVGVRLAEAAAAGPVGVMFHHAHMDAAELTAAGALLDLLVASPNARCSSLRDRASRLPSVCPRRAP